MANIFDQFDAREEQRTSNVFDQFDPKPKKEEPTESGGFFGPLGTAFKERVETALPAAKIYTGLGDQQKATEELLKAKERSAEAYKQTEFSEIGDAFKAGNYGDALGKTIDKFKEVAGSSLGAMAPAMAAGAAGAGAAAAGAVALPAAAVGTAAFGVVALGSYIADNIGRQKEELDKEGNKYADVNRLSATAAGAVQTALDVFGFKFFKPLGSLVGIEGKAAAEQTAMEIVEAAVKPRAYARAVATGAAKGVAFEVPQEVTQQVLERWQAGLPLDPFSDPEAAKEYMEAAGGAMLLGGPMGSYSSAMETRKARATPEGQNLLGGVKQGSALDTLGQETEDVTRPIEPAGGESAGVAGEPGGGVPAGRPAGADTGRVVPTGQDVGDFDAGEGQQPPALSIDDFRQNYSDVRQELLGLMANQRPTEADMRTMKLVARDLNDVVDSYAGVIKDRQLIQQLKNPMFDGLPIIDAIASQQGGQARGMQGDMFDNNVLVRGDVAFIKGERGEDPKASAGLRQLTQDDDAYGAVGDATLITGIDTNQRGKGFGTKLLQGLTGWADSNNKRLALIPAAQPDSSLGGLDSQQLEAWYARNGFTQVGDFMVREPIKAGQARGMQGDMFKGADRRADSAAALEGKSPEELLKGLNDQRARIQRSYDSGKFDSTWAMRVADQFGISKAQALQNPEVVAQAYMEKAFGQIDQAVANLQRHVGKARGMQGDMFGNKRDYGEKESTLPLENQAEFDAYRAAKERVAGQAAAPTPVQGDVSTTAPTQLTDIYTARLGKLGNQLASAKNDLQRMQELASRPAGERVERPTPEQIQSKQKEINSIERELKGIQNEIANAQKDAAAGVTSVKAIPQAKEEKAPTSLFEDQEAELAAANKKPKTALKLERAEGPKETEDLAEAIEQANKLRRELEDTGIAGEFGAEEKETRRPEYDEEGERIAYDQKGRPIRAPKAADAKEHVAETPEGQKIKRFFDAIESQSTDPDEQDRQQQARNVAAETMLEYDIAGPNEESPAGIKQMLDYLARRVGGMEKLDALLAKIEGATADSQSYYFERAGLPDLTTRRGMDKFRDEIKAYESQVNETAGGVRIPTKQVASKITKTPIPYREEVTYIGSITKPRGPSPEGKPRRPTVENVEKKYVIQDSKVRTAIRNLKQKLSAKGKLTAQEQATISYLNNPMRESFGEALTSLAYDVAYYEHDSDNHGANTLFFGEGGKYATAFKDWVEANLDQTTIDTLNNLIADHKSTIAENEKYVVEKRKATVAKRQYSKQQAAAEAEAARYDKEKKKERKKLTKEGLTTVVEEEDYEHNLPRKEMVAEIHPLLRGLLADGKTQEALEILAQSKGNKYYAALAQRLIEANLTAKTRLIDTNVIEPLNNTAEVRESLSSRLDVMTDIVKALYPAGEQKAILDGLRSKKLKELIGTAQSLRETLPKNNAAPAQMDVVNSLVRLLEDEYGWVGKYDPKTDEIILRSGGGYLTNHLFLHETLHAATSHLIDNADKLSGIQRQGYDRLVELYNYAKPILTDPAYNYAFSDLHEFVSEAMTNPDLQLELRKLGYKASKVSLWNTFTEAIRKLFKVTKGDSNVLVETMLATDALIAGPMNLEGLQASSAKGAKGPRPKVMRPGLPNQPSTVQRWLNTRSWSEARREFSSLSAAVRPVALGALTLRQIADLVRGRITQVDNFVRVSEEFLSHKNGILKESADIAKKWERLQSKDAVMSRQLGEVMAMATIKEVDPDKATTNQRNNNQDLMTMWRALTPEAQQVYKDVRNFYERRYSEYKTLMNQRIIQMRKLGVSEATITEIRNEFEKAKLKGPYFPLMRFGRFWYQVGKGTDREFYMFESQAARDRHIEERLARDPHLADTIGDKVGNSYETQMDFHARESKFLKETFAAIDSSNAGNKQELKDTIYQTYLANQPDRSMRNQFIHRQNVAGYSEDALRSFASSSFNMAYQLSRFRYSPEMFSQIEAARMQIKDRQDAATGYDPEVTRENDELTDYVNEVEERLKAMMNPPDVGRLPQLLSNAGFIWYLTAPASAIVNVLGGMMVGLPTLIGQQVKANPKMSYTTATLNSLAQMKTVAGEIMRTGFQVTKADKVIDTELDFPSLDRSTQLSKIERAAYNRFVADGLIDITATYDQSGLAEAPTTSYTGAGHRTMVILSKLFHNAERFNREVMAMAAFRSALEKYKGQNLSDRAAFAKAIAEAKDITNRSMFDYSSANKPRYFQHPVARVVTQFKQFPQQMTYFLCQNLYNSIKGESPEVKREARARFVGTMGMAAIFSGVTGIWGFSTVASIANAVFNGLGDDDEEPFDFELEFVNWANETFGANIGTLLARGAGNAAGIDLASRVKLDDMWFRDGRKNLDASASWKDKLVELLGPSVGLTINVTDAMDLYSKGHGDRALEKVMPAFIKNPMVAARYANEGVRNMTHDPLIENVGAFDLLMQSLGIRSAELAERQFYNMTKKGQEQEIHKQRQNLLNLYGLTFMSGDVDRNMETFEAMMKFSKKHPTMAIDADVLINSITERLNKAAQTDHGLYVDPKLRQLLNEGYKDKISRPNVFDRFH